MLVFQHSNTTRIFIMYVLARLVHDAFDANLFMFALTQTRRTTPTHVQTTDQCTRTTMYCPRTTTHNVHTINHNTKKQVTKEFKEL